MIGSCFTRYIGGKLLRYKLPVFINPAGIQYNPASIAEVVQRLAENRPFTGEELRFSGDLWFSYLHHGDFSDTDRERCLGRINEYLEAGRRALVSAHVFCITFGTAFYFRLKETGDIVSNCHKRPQNLFTRHFLTPGKITGIFSSLMTGIRKIYPDIRFLFTVSPVRHLKDGAEENQWSKSSLILAVRELLEVKGTYYFPSYEIMMDDLRDYRFYAEDLVHPNGTAAGYIWERFSQAYLTEDTLGLCRGLEQILKAAEHRPRHENSGEHRKFIRATLDRIDEFTEGNPFIDLSDEKRELRGRLVAE